MRIVISIFENAKVLEPVTTVFDVWSEFIWIDGRLLKLNLVNPHQTLDKTALLDESVKVAVVLAVALKVL